MEIFSKNYKNEKSAKEKLKLIEVRIERKKFSLIERLSISLLYKYFDRSD